jgi:hypothetical protein
VITRLARLHVLVTTSEVHRRGVRRMGSVPYFWSAVEPKYLTAYAAASTRAPEVKVCQKVADVVPGRLGRDEQAGGDLGVG